MQSRFLRAHASTDNLGFRSKVVPGKPCVWQNAVSQKSWPNNIIGILHQNTPMRREEYGYCNETWLCKSNTYPNVNQFVVKIGTLNVHKASNTERAEGELQPTAHLVCCLKPYHSFWKQVLCKSILCRPPTVFRFLDELLQNEQESLSAGPEISLQIHGVFVIKTIHFHFQWPCVHLGPSGYSCLSKPFTVTICPTTFNVPFKVYPLWLCFQSVTISPSAIECQRYYYWTAAIPSCLNDTVPLEVSLKHWII